MSAEKATFCVQLWQKFYGFGFRRISAWGSFSGHPAGKPYIDYRLIFRRTPCVSVTDLVEDEFRASELVVNGIDRRRRTEDIRETDPDHDGYGDASGSV